MTKVILSRKGFDSSSGRNASPVYVNKFFPFQIPRAGSDVFYKDLQFHDGRSYLDVMKDLRITHYSECHLDPDLYKPIMKHRSLNWRPIFGQTGIPEATLRNEEVSKGDLFLFYGWYKHLYEENGRFYYERNDRGFHAIFGYLEVEEVFRLDKENVTIPLFATEHDHVRYRQDFPEVSSLYVGRDRFLHDKNKPGAGLFYFDEELKLTRPNESISRWRLPRCFRKAQDCFKHKITEVPTENRKEFHINFSGRGSQETFISDHPEVVAWAKDLVKRIKVQT